MTNQPLLSYRPRFEIRRFQRGTTLIVSLIMLLLLTIIGTSAIRSTLMDERMAGNTRDQQIAFQAAEAALRDAESYLTDLLQNAVIPAFNNSTPGLITTQTNPGRSSTWDAFAWANNSRVYSNTLGGVTVQPRYVIERLTTPKIGVVVGQIDEVVTYRITARGTGPAGSVAYVQTVYKQ